MTEDEQRRAAQTALVLQVLGTTDTVADAARALGISERTIYRRMKEYGIRIHRHPVTDREAA